MSQQSCELVTVKWAPPSSCSKLLRNQIQCLGADNNLETLPAIPGDQAEYTFSSEMFTSSPMNLKKGDALVCYMHSESKLGWSVASPLSSAVLLDVCKSSEPTSPVEP